MIRLGVSIREWLSTVPELADLNKDFALFYSHSLTARLSNPPPNPFLDTPMLAERVQRWINVYRAEGEARGKAEGEAWGKAEGLISEILALVADGDLPRERAVVRLRQHAEQGLITPVQLATALAVLKP